MSEDKELAALRAKKQAELEQQYAAQQQQDAQMEVIEQQRTQALITILTDDARTRLLNIKLANPNLANTIENQLISLGQSGRLKARITDDQLKTMLRQLQGSKRESSIHYKRK